MREYLAAVLAFDEDRLTTLVRVRELEIDAFGLGPGLHRHHIKRRQPAVDSLTLVESACVVGQLSNRDWQAVISRRARAVGGSSALAGRRGGRLGKSRKIRLERGVCTRQTRREQGHALRRATTDDEVAPPRAVPLAVDDPAPAVAFELSAATFSELARLSSGPVLGVSARTEAAEKVPARSMTPARVREIAEPLPGSSRDLHRSVGMTALLPTAVFRAFVRKRDLVDLCAGSEPVAKTVRPSWPGYWLQRLHSPDLHGRGATRLEVRIGQTTSNH